MAKLKIPISDEDFNHWKARVTAACDKRKLTADLQRENLDRYRGQALSDQPKHDTVVVNKDFSNVEQKKAQLFFQQPDIQVTPLQPLTGREDAATIWQAVLNHHLGPYGVDALTVVDECLFDCLCPSGYAASKIGYTAIVDGEIPIKVGEQPAIDPTTGQPAVMPTGQPQMTPIMEPGPRIIFEEYYWRRFSPLKVLFPADFYGSDYDKAAWLGMEFVKPLAVAKEEYGLPDDFADTLHKDENLLVEDDLPRDTSAQYVKGYEIWYKAHLYDRKVRHPEQQRCLVYIDGAEGPAKHEESPFQRFDEQTGRQIAGMTGFPIHILTLRYLGDSCYPPSDCTMSRNQTDELSKFRTTMLLQRERSIPMRVADLGRIGGQEGLDKIQKNIWQGIIPLESYDRNNPPLDEIARADYPKDNFQFNDYIDRDISETWAMGANQRGNQTDTVRTATELNLVQKNTDNRLDKERGRVLGWYTKGVQKLASLIQLFADEEDYIQVVGQNGAQRLEVWDKHTIQGKFAYAMKPDSSIRIDAAEDRKQALEFINYTAKSPNMNQAELMTWLCRKYNVNPAKVLTQPPESGPPPPSLAFRFSGDDLISPAAPMVLQLMEQAGFKINPEMGPDMRPEALQEQAAANAQIPGTAPKADVVSKGAVDRSHEGGRTNGHAVQRDGGGHFGGLSERGASRQVVKLEALADLVLLILAMAILWMAVRVW